VIAQREASGGRAFGLAGSRASAVARPASSIEPWSLAASSMGGRLVVHLDAGPDAVEAASKAGRRTVDRIDRWASLITRHTDTSDLSRLNADMRPDVGVGPTLAAALRAGRLAAEASEGLVDVTLLDARLAAEGLVGAAAGEAPAAPAAIETTWSLTTGRYGSAMVHRAPGTRFDLDGVGKGWIADRALDLLAEWPSAVIDADGDLALRCVPGRFWEVAVDDPRTPDTTLAILHLGASGDVPARLGVATSGTSIHRWVVAGRTSHHLIDPRTRRPAETDVIQATVVAGSALRAEALAKAAVIAGSLDGLALLDRAGVRGAVILTEGGETLALPQTTALLGG
jgi:thiamine biosynthesis lipoprotein